MEGEVQWMWGDAPPLAWLNPARWSEAQYVQAALEDLNSYCHGPYSSRPVALKYWRNGKQNRKAANVSMAMTVLREAFDIPHHSRVSGAGAQPGAAYAAAGGGAAVASTAVPVQAIPVVGTGTVAAKAAPVQAVPVTQVTPIRPEAPPVPRAPRAPSSFPELESLDLRSLHDMSANPPAVNDWLQDLPAVRDYTRQLGEARAASGAAASGLLGREVAVSAAVSKLEFQRAALAERKAAVQVLLQRRSELADREAHAQPRAAAELESRARAADADAEAYLNDLLDADSPMGEDAIAEFKRQYVEGKMLKHQRLAMKERLS